MGIIDSFRKSKDEKKDENKEHPTPPPEGHVLVEILQDKKKFGLFSMLLGKDGYGDLALRLVKGELKGDDIGLLEQERLAFSEKLTKSEKIKKLLTKENVIGFARNHPEFEKIINLVGPEKAIKAIQGQLEEISITDENRFDNISDSIQTYDSYKNGKYKEVNDRVEKLCKDKNITPQEYLDALAIKDPKEKEKALKELSKRTYGKFKSTINFISRGKWAKNTTLEGLKTSEISLEDSVAELDNYQRDIGSVLFYSISDNDDMRKAMSNELINERTPEKPKTGLGDIKQEIGENTLDEDKFGADWEAFKEREAYGAAYDNEQGALKDKFLSEQKEAYKKKNANVGGKGWWHSFLAILFEGKINSKKDTLK